MMIDPQRAELKQDRYGKRYRYTCKARLCFANQPPRDPGGKQHREEQSDCRNEDQRDKLSGARAKDRCQYKDDASYG